MMKTNNEFALKSALELAKTNIESSQEFTSPEAVTHFVNEVYSFLTGEKETDD